MLGNVDNNTEISISPNSSHGVILHTLVANLSEQRLSCMDSANAWRHNNSQTSDYAEKVEENDREEVKRSHYLPNLKFHLRLNYCFPQRVLQQV